jgi:hypothetical protein
MENTNSVNPEGTQPSNNGLSTPTTRAVDEIRSTPEYLLREEKGYHFTLKTKIIVGAIAVGVGFLPGIILLVIDFLS